MQNTVQKLLIACLFVNMLLTCALLLLGWKVYSGLERVDKTVDRIEKFAAETMGQGGNAKEKAIDTYKKYHERKDKK